jgi:RNA polymerase sigma factor (sigma-70 family)
VCPCGRLHALRTGNHGENAQLLRCYRVVGSDSSYWTVMEVSALSHPSSITGLRGPSALLRLQSDERLIALTRRGQHAAFEVLCARYQSRLLSFCRHMLASREDAEDVLQEVFAAAFNAVLADQRDINVRPWLYRIARNRSLNHLRRASAIGVDSMDIHFADGGISTGDKVLRRESFRELIADVHQLPETQRTALLLREIDALSYEQIALAMDTTVPSVKSLLVRARISLAEAAEARKLSCEEVRLELGGVAEGLAKLSTPARRHVRGCERCSFFRKQLKENNRALALVMPVGPLLLLKKLLLAKLGSASAGGAHVAGGAGAAATAGAGAAAGAGGSVAGSIVTAGAGAIATKAVAGLAAAAIVTAGVAAADHGAVHHHPHATASAATSAYADEPVVVRQALQPITATVPAPSSPPPARHQRRHLVLKPTKPAVPVTPPATTPASAATTVGAVTPPAKPATPQPITEVTTQTTELPASATTVPAATPTPPTTTTTPVSPPPTPAAPGTPAGTTHTETAPAPSTPPAAPTPGAEGSAAPNSATGLSPSDVNTGGTAAPANTVTVTSPPAALSHTRTGGAGSGAATRRSRTRSAR